MPDKDVFSKSKSVRHEVKLLKNKNFISRFVIDILLPVVAFVVTLVLSFDPILSSCQYSDEAGSLTSSNVSNRSDCNGLSKIKTNKESLTVLRSSDDSILKVLFKR